MARVLGIIGGGQLGMMLAEAAARMPGQVSGVVVLDPGDGCPAALAGARQIRAAYDDGEAIMRLASECDIITYEIESGDPGHLEAASRRAEVQPPPGTLRTIQDKLLQKEFLRGRGIPVPEFEGVDPADIAGTSGRLGLPMVVKARRGGYDGRGNYMVRSAGDARAALEYFGDRPLLAERRVDFDAEISVIAARGAGGTATYAPVENIHGDGILRTTVAPARIPSGVAESAGRLAGDVMDALEGAGVFGIEMFVEGGDVMVNEIAPRVHNSGHHTLQSCATSQFEQHLRAVLGMELGPTDLLCDAVMQNILGPAGFEGPYVPPPDPGDGVHLKMYGKAESRPSRKLGHATLVGGPAGSLLERSRSLDLAVRPC
ncbi:N5-carboxyaminoimidazole ribonucleotide synthase [Nitrosopumilaceae archaeon]|nr:5-(carboxyamino)imidazole ribonucleotide synthase [Nitrosopumilus sp.]CAI9831286.1 N5-carboxyaminoimidazole ribonucleotide synthase [Nitrosopumilaceae archaeon]MDA7944336.1 5-(carboxyamino)imidazole ribonucleotide synthase [Nitrosopumilus sp.]MDA7954088.1 5-(carboxyamino)imidazole ribonucleotide synthase [Nitrosopumilus sp.]MDA7973016.1 5-(carboxyamino)imidazole ribonucleotide synthase [Nitrosopumilus sp.]